MHLSSAQSVVYALWEEVPKLVYYRLICKPVVRAVYLRLNRVIRNRIQFPVIFSSYLNEDGGHQGEQLLSSDLSITMLMTTIRYIHGDNALRK